MFTSNGTLRLADLNNQANFSANSIGVTLGASGAGQLGLPLTSAGVGSASDSAQSTTQSAISGIAGNTAARTGDQSTPLARIFDAEKVRNDIAAQVTITAEFGKQASHTVSTYIDGQRNALQDALKKSNKPEEQASLKSQISDLTLQERVLNILIGAVSGQGGSALTKESLSAAAEKMRNLMIEDSTTSRGVVDSTGFELSNLSGESVGLRGDGRKIGGTRVDLDLLCGTDNSRCKTATNPDGTQKLDENGKVQLATDSKGRIMFSKGSIESFIQTPEGQKMVGATGGIQGYKGTLFGNPYTAGSLIDRLIEAFAGTHDFIGGNRSGLYDKQGNARRGRSSTIQALQNTWSATGAIALSAPFAVAEWLSPEVWNAIATLIKAAK
jgi:filamentous hemagglutinin